MSTSLIPRHDVGSSPTLARDHSRDDEADDRRRLTSYGSNR
jgi:hypothetical protein